MPFVRYASVFTKLTFVGFHRWPNAPEDTNYLSARHRHLFGVTAEVSVVGDDREVEFHALQRKVTARLDSTFHLNRHGEYELDAASCEQIAELILTALREAFPGRDFYHVTVNEDGENGSSVEYQESTAPKVIHEPVATGPES